MSAADVTPERIAQLWDFLGLHEHPRWRGDNLMELRYREVKALLMAIQERDTLRAEVQRLAEESRRPAAVQGVEVPEQCPRVEQTVMHIPGESRGNCFAAVFAGLLQVPIESIPDFDGPDWRKQVNAFLRPYGLAWLQVGIDKEWLEDSGVSGMWHEVSGTTTRFDGKVRHSCAALDAEVAWDPHPSQSGLADQNGASIFVALQPWKMAHSRLSPSPQPATGADDHQESHPIGTADSGYFRRELRSLLERMGNADGPWLARYLSRLAAVADPSPQPSADVVDHDEGRRIGAWACYLLQSVLQRPELVAKLPHHIPESDLPRLLEDARNGERLLCHPIKPSPSADVVVPREDAELAVQWFHAVQDLNPKFLNSEDGVAYKRFCALRSAQAQPTTGEESK